MVAAMSARRLAVTVWVNALLLVGGGGPSLTDNTSIHVTNQIEVSLSPTVTANNATPQQLRQLEEAIARFRSAGLLLPELNVEFDADGGGCGQHLGVFQPGATPWRIVICASLDAVYEHELAHAWELANLDDKTRRRFMEYRGHEFWNDAAVPWDERGVEGAAFIIQQGLVGLPLPPTLSAENHSRLVAYAILTGRLAPRLLEWVGLDSERFDCGNPRTSSAGPGC